MHSCAQEACVRFFWPQTGAVAVVKAECVWQQKGDLALLFLVPVLSRAPTVHQVKVCICDL